MTPANFAPLRPPSKASGKPAVPSSGKSDLRFLKLGEVATLLRMSHATVYRLVHRGQLPVYRVCHKLLFKHDDVMAFIERSAVPHWSQ